MLRKTRDTEVDAYVFIKENLKVQGWDVRNPERVPAGQVYTQNECLANPEIKRLLGLKRPENIVKVTEQVLWVIEAKRAHTELEQALADAMEKAKILNQSKAFQVKFISGVAGNQLDGFFVRTRFFDGKDFVPVSMNGVEVTALPSPTNVQLILSADNPNIEDPIIDEKLFLSRAERINEILHLGAVNPHQRAGVMAALLLSMLSATGPNIEERSPLVLIRDINARIESVLKSQGKPEFIEYIRIVPSATPDNHAKFRKALVDTIQELNNLNIRSAMNSGADWLGAFYEVFLKYANWAQDLGIVLTPRHVTRWTADVVGVQINDIVYDPCCGTGGFLVAAFDYVKRRITATQLAQFKQNCLFGIEQDAAIAALAVVNMIFRGDGKNNIVEGNCFSKFLQPVVNNGVPTARYATKPSDSPPVTRVMMNPPFTLKRSDEKQFKFVDQALRQVQHGGLLFSILQYSAMVRPGVYLTWRKHSLLADNTLLAVVTFPIDLFYPIGVTTVGVFVKRGTPHPKSQKVLWVRALSDGLLKSKGKRLPNPKAANDLTTTKDLLKAFIHNPDHPVPNVHQFHKTAPIDFSDQSLELVPEVYLDQAQPTKAEITEAMENAVRDMFAYLVKINQAVLKPELLKVRPRQMPISPSQWRAFTISSLFDLKRGNFHSIAALDPGSYPTISRISTDNGFVGFYDRPAKAKIWPSGTMTVSTVTGDAFVQPVPFLATDNVVLCTPKPQHKNVKLTTLFFVALMLNFVKWRYSYGRQCYKTKFAKTEILLPVMETGDLDETYMASVVENTTYWPLVMEVFSRQPPKLQNQAFRNRDNQPPASLHS